MKRCLTFIILSFSIFFFSCTPKKANVKIKAGIVMKSGDIKTVARQDFFIVRVDICSLWETSKEECQKKIKMNEDEMKIEMDYDNKIKELQNELKKNKESLAKKVSGESPEVIEIVNKMITFLTSSEYAKEDAGRLKKGETNFAEAIQIYVDVHQFYESLFQLYRRYQSLQKKVQSEFEKFQEIRKLYDNLSKRVEISRSNISKIDKEITKIEEELVEKLFKKIEQIRQNNIIDFQSRLNEELVLLSKTNLNGETSFEIKRGQYFLFGMIQIGQSNLIWNLPLNIEEKEMYIELSNDNAFAIDDNDLFNELLGAFEGFKIVNSNQKKNIEASGSQLPKALASLD